MNNEQYEKEYAEIFDEACDLYSDIAQWLQIKIEREKYKLPVVHLALAMTIESLGVVQNDLGSDVLEPTYQITSKSDPTIN